MFLPVIKPMARMVLRILSFILFAVMIACAYGGRVDPRISAIPGIAVMALPYLAIATFIVTVLWFLAGRWFTGAVGILALAAAWGPISNAVPLRFPHNPRQGAVSFKLMTWNFMHGWNMSGKDLTAGEDDALGYIMKSGADIVCLQELIHWNKKETPTLTDAVRHRFDSIYPYMAFQPTKDTRVFSKYPVKHFPGTEIGARLADIHGPQAAYDHVSFFDVNIKGRHLMLVNVHLHSPGLDKEQQGVMTSIRSVSTAKESAREFNDTIKDKIKHSLVQHDSDLNTMCKILENYHGPVIVCGDFNDVPESHALLKMKKAGFHSVQAEVGLGPLITFNQHMMWFQLDHILYRGDIRPLNIRKGRIRTSDHYPLTSDFEFTD